MKEYQKPSVEFILLSAKEEIAAQGEGAEGSMSTVPNPFG